MELKKRQCLSNYAGLCVHEIEVEKELQKREILAKDMEHEIHVLNLKNKISRSTIASYEKIINSTRDVYRADVERFDKKYKGIKHQNDVLKSDLSELKECLNRVYWFWLLFLSLGLVFGYFFGYFLK